MKNLEKEKAALTFGLFLGGWHLVWSLLILLQLAQPLLNLVFWLHMITPPYQVTAFGFTQALILMVITFTAGYAGGWIFAWLWNKIAKI